jgi:hypothetical protein
MRTMKAAELTRILRKEFKATYPGIELKTLTSRDGLRAHWVDGPGNDLVWATLKNAVIQNNGNRSLITTRRSLYQQLTVNGQLTLLAGTYLGETAPYLKGLPNCKIETNWRHALLWLRGHDLSKMSTEAQNLGNALNSVILVRYPNESGRESWTLRSNIIGERLWREEKATPLIASLADALGIQVN